jgi:hypothetical protein
MRTCSCRCCGPSGKLLSGSETVGPPGRWKHSFGSDKVGLGDGFSDSSAAVSRNHFRVAELTLSKSPFGATEMVAGKGYPPSGR